jgi:hypothetical protein
MNKKEKIFLQHKATKYKINIINKQCRVTCGDKDKYPNCGNQMCRAFMLCKEIDKCKVAIDEGKEYIQDGKFI